MRIKMRERLALPERVYEPDTTYEVAREFGEGLVARGTAIELDAPRPTPIVAPPEDETNNKRVTPPKNDDAGGPTDPLELPISALESRGIDSRYLTAAEKAGVATIGDLVEYGKLDAINGISANAAKEIGEAVAALLGA